MITLATIQDFPLPQSFTDAEAAEQQKFLNIAIARLHPYGFDADSDLEPHEAAALADFVAKLWLRPESNVELPAFTVRTLGVDRRNYPKPIPLDPGTGSQSASQSAGGPGVDATARAEAQAAHQAAERAQGTADANAQDIETVRGVADANAGKLMPPNNAEADKGTANTIRGWTAALIRRVVEGAVPAWAREANPPVAEGGISEARATAIANAAANAAVENGVQTPARAAPGNAINGKQQYFAADWHAPDAEVGQSLLAHQNGSTYWGDAAFPAVAQVSPSHADKANPPSYFRVTVHSKPNAFPLATKLRLTLLGRTVTIAYKPDTIIHTTNFQVTAAMRNALAALATDGVASETQLTVTPLDASDRVSGPGVIPGYDLQVIAGASTSSATQQELMFFATGDSDLLTRTEATKASRLGDTMETVFEPASKRVTIVMDNRLANNNGNFLMLLPFEIGAVTKFERAGLGDGVSGYQPLSGASFDAVGDAPDTLTRVGTILWPRSKTGSPYYAYHMSNVGMSVGSRYAFRITYDAINPAIPTAQIDKAVTDAVADWAEDGNADKIPSSKLPDDTPLTPLQQIGLLNIEPDNAAIRYDTGGLEAALTPAIKVRIANPEIVTGDVWVEGLIEGQPALARRKWTNVTNSLDLTLQAGNREAVATALLADGEQPSVVLDLHFYDAAVAGNVIEIRKVHVALAERQLPEPTAANGGKVAAVKNDGSVYELIDQFALPALQAADVGKKILGVIRDSGVVKWGKVDIPSGGGSSKPELLAEVAHGASKKLHEAPFKRALTAEDDGKIIEVLVWNNAWNFLSVSFDAAVVRAQIGAGQVGAGFDGDVTFFESGQFEVYGFTQTSGTNRNKAVFQLSAPANGIYAIKAYLR